MDRRKAREVARRHAAAWLQTLLNDGWPRGMQNCSELVGYYLDDPPKSEEDLKRLEETMEEIIVRLYP